MSEQMNGAKEDEALNAIDRELSQLLAVEPSPEFAATVRARIAERPAPRAAWRFWTMTAVATAAAMTLFVIMMDRGAPDIAPPASVHADIILPAVKIVQETNNPAPPVVRMHTTSLRPTPRLLPEILIDPSLAAAVRRLTTRPRVLPQLPPEPSLEPVVIEPLKVSEISDVTKQGDRQ